MSAVDDVLARAENVRPNGKGWICACPTSRHDHGDRHPSLSIAIGDRTDVVFNCFKGCTAEEIVIALGLEPREILGARRDGDVVPFRRGRTEARRPAVIARTVYDVQGYEHVRLEYDDGSKSFVWRHDGQNGLPKGVRGEDLLYGAEGLAELPDGATVVFTEGERACDAAREAGHHAVATVTGAAGTPSEAALGQLIRFDVVLWADNDDPGCGHMQRTAERLIALGATPRWVVWPDAPAKGDAANAAPEERSRLIREAVVYDINSFVQNFNLLRVDESIELFVTARDFATTAPAEPAWIARPYIASGAITEVAGKLKASGKTTWLLALCRKVLDGEPFMGQPTSKTGVIYLTEQGGPSFRAALARAGLLDRDDFLILFWSRARGLDWPTIVQAAVTKAKTGDYGLLAVDTLGQFSGLTGDSENQSGAAMDAMKPLQDATAEGLGVAIARHERKGGGEVGESGRGSSAYSGAVDIVLSIRRAEGQAKESVRVIHALGRFDDTPAELVVDLIDGEYVALGTGQDVKAQEARTLIFDGLPVAEDDAIATKDLLEQLAEAKLKRTLVYQILDELSAAGEVRHLGKGKKGDPKRYWRPADIHSSAAPVVPDESISDDADYVDEEV